MRQVQWFELLKQYKFIIHYTSRKDNGRADTLNKKPDYIIIKKNPSHYSRKKKKKHSQTLLFN